MDVFTKEFIKEVKNSPQVCKQWEKGMLCFNEAYNIILKQAQATAEREAVAEYRNKLAKRIYELDIYEARNNDTTPEEIAGTIFSNPYDVIGYLLDIIDELQL